MNKLGARNEGEADVDDNTDDIEIDLGFIAKVD